ncbi:F-box domain-containing protein [Colletotrichum graminicola]|uniref:F-box domain-containing protein n=1 Tax=Colletotrichum graminicola (strain M1.001 / M2 / FGSC 10212) TaxID=645133 RepID=E3QF36_COLGM|nr:F-box domain-containing protein [Colletotrichum graminicola M1.001]EFQ29474.1 F-box domain-containing protein [Colletotrichum graminicola M1.001]WDK23413.1 F-box domain-containing protein [Colletotrichum graminicola]
MATASSLRAAPHKWSLNGLSSELIALIFEQLREIDDRALAAARCLSRRFEAIATPITYRTLCLNERIVALDADSRYPNLLCNVSTYTNHVIARSDLDPDGIRRVLDRVQRLKTVRWHYVDAEFRSGRLWLPSDLLHPQQTRFRGTKLFVEDLPLREFEGQLRDTYIRAIPTDLLVSLKLASPAPPLTTRLNSLKQFLLLSRRLETFHYEDRGQGTNFKFAEGERMPPLKDLVLKSYDWNHSKEDTRLHWDFTQLESLDLISVPIINFLTAVDFTHLAGLRRLHCEDFSAHLADRRQEATGGLYLLVAHHIRALQTLSVTCHIQLFPLDGILRHGASLQLLRFRDHVGFGDEDRRCPTLWAEDIATLARGLPFVHTLELDMDVALCDPTEFLRAICSFRSLQTLILHVQTVLHPLEVVYPGIDRDYDAALRTFQFLLREKQLATPHVPWKQITINVGGWRKVMVRRFSTAWRQQNENGVYAERCFVLEKNEYGQMAFREEMSVEGRSSTPTPDPPTPNFETEYEE